MSLDEVGSVSELISSIAVLISLVYLAIQIRSNTDAARTSTYQAVVAEFSALNRTMASTPDLSILYVNALEDFESLSPEEKARISQLFFTSFHNFENMYYQRRKNYLEDDVWLGWKRLMLTYYARPGFQTWWQKRSDVYSASFVDFLRTEKIDKPVATYRDITAVSGGSN
ncbi:MAG: hypothetical protein WBM54_03710 [Woeseia sp.]